MNMPPLATYFYNLALISAISGAGIQDNLPKALFMLAAFGFAFVGYKIHKDE